MVLPLGQGAGSVPIPWSPTRGLRQVVLFDRRCVHGPDPLVPDEGVETRVRAGAIKQFTVPIPWSPTRGLRREDWRTAPGAPGPDPLVPDEGVETR